MKRLLLALALLFCTTTVQAQITSTARLSALTTGTAGNITGSSYLLFTDPAFAQDRKISPTVLFDAAGFGPTDTPTLGGIQVNGNVTSTGNGVFTGNVSLTGNLATTGTSIFTGTVTVNGVLDSNLTSGRVPYLSTGGILVDNAGFLFDGTLLTTTNALHTGTLAVTGNTALTGNLTTTGNLAVTGTTNLTGTTTVAGKGIFSSGIVNGAGFQHERLTTGGLLANTTTSVAVTWDTAFADTNYTPVFSVIEASTTSTGLVPLRIVDFTATNCTVLIQNNTAGTLTGTITIHAIHD